MTLITVSSPKQLKDIVLDVLRENPESSHQRIISA